MAHLHAQNQAYMAPPPPQWSAHSSSSASFPSSSSSAALQPPSYYAYSTSSAPSSAPLSIPSIHQHASAAKQFASQQQQYGGFYASSPPTSAAPVSYYASPPHQQQTQQYAHMSPSMMSPAQVQSQAQSAPGAPSLFPPSYAAAPATGPSAPFASLTPSPASSYAAHNQQPQQQAQRHGLPSSLSTPSLHSAPSSAPAAAAVASSPPAASSLSTTPSPALTAAPTLPAVLSQLDARFLLNLPDEELSSFERILFQLQQAHWFYLDEFCERWAALPKLGFKSFCSMYFKHLPSFRAHLSRFESVYASFSRYLAAVPVCGAILLDPALERVLLVRSWGANVWGFPRGKLDANEDEVDCAIREVREEVGFDCSRWFKGHDELGADAPLVRQSSSSSTVSATSSSAAAQQPSYLEVHSDKKTVRLYVLQGVDPATRFQTQTRKEIAAIEWVPLACLPTKHSNQHEGYPFGRMMAPFAAKLRKFVKKLRSGAISGYGRYGGDKDANSPRQGPQPSPSQQQQPQSAKKQQRGGAKAKEAANSSSSAPSAQRRPSEHKGGGKHWELDAKNGETFAAASNASASNGGAAWSVEQMLAANARLGFVSTVAEERPTLPAHLDAALDAALGRGPKGQAKKGAKRSVTCSPPPAAPFDQFAALGLGLAEPSKLALGPNATLCNPAAPGKGGSSAPSAASAGELDFGHNPYVNFANLSLHQQGSVVPQAGSNAAATPPPPSDKKPRQRKPKQQQQQQAGANAADGAASSPDVQAQSQSQPGQKKGKGGRGKKQAQQQQGGDKSADAAVPQYRIMQRPKDGAVAQGPLGPVSASAPTVSHM